MTDNAVQHSRIREIQRRFVELDAERKNLMQELYSLVGVPFDGATRKTTRNTLTPEQARRLCLQPRR